MDGCSCSSWTSRRCAGLARRNETARAALGGSLPSAPVWRGGVALPLLQPGRNVVTVPPGESQPSSDLGPSVLSRPPFCMHPSRRLVSPPRGKGQKRQRILGGARHGRPATEDHWPHGARDGEERGSRTARSGERETQATAAAAVAAAAATVLAAAACQRGADSTRC